MEGPLSNYFNFIVNAEVWMLQIWVCKALGHKTLMSKTSEWFTKISYAGKISP